MLSGVANQGVNEFDSSRKVIVVADAPTPIWQACGFAVFVVHINQVDVARHVQFTCAELAHADDPQRGTFAAGCGGHAVAVVELCLGLFECSIECEFAQFGHSAGDHIQAGMLLTVEHHQALHHQVAQHAQ